MNTLIAVVFFTGLFVVYVCITVATIKAWIEEATCMVYDPKYFFNSEIISFACTTFFLTLEIIVAIFVLGKIF